ncbi:MAG: cytoskeleton protein RodZ, partial [Halothiobacillaceae bacterium]
PGKPLETTAANAPAAVINPPKITASRVTPPALPSAAPPAVAGGVNAQKPTATAPASTESSADGGAGKTSIKLRFTEDSWVDIRDATESRLTAKIGRAGTETTLQGVPPLRVVLGNASAVAIEYEGKTIEVPKARRNQVVRFEVGEKSAE